VYINVLSFLHFIKYSLFRKYLGLYIEPCLSREKKRPINGALSLSVVTAI